MRYVIDDDRVIIVRLWHSSRNIDRGELP